MAKARPRYDNTSPSDAFERFSRLSGHPYASQLRCLRWRARQYLRYTRLAARPMALMPHILSPTLHLELCVLLYYGVFSHSPFLRYLPCRLCKQLLSCLDDRYFCPGDFLLRYGEEASRLYFVGRGRCLVREYKNSQGENLPKASGTDSAWSDMSSEASVSRTLGTSWESIVEWGLPPGAYVGHEGVVASTAEMIRSTLWVVADGFVYTTSLGKEEFASCFVDAPDLLHDIAQEAHAQWAHWACEGKKETLKQKMMGEWRDPQTGDFPNSANRLATSRDALSNPQGKLFFFAGVAKKTQCRLRSLSVRISSKGQRISKIGSARPTSIESNNSAEMTPKLRKGNQSPKGSVQGPWMEEAEEKGKESQSQCLGEGSPRPDVELAHFPSFDGSHGVDVVVPNLKTLLSREIAFHEAVTSLRLQLESLVVLAAAR